MRLCWRVKFKSVLLLVTLAACLVVVSLLQAGSPSSANEGGLLSRGARGGDTEKEKELEAFLTELQENHSKREGEEGRVAPRKALELNDRNPQIQREDTEVEVKRDAIKMAVVVEKKQEDGVEERVTEVRNEMERYPIGRRGRQEPGGKEEGVKREQNQRRLFSQRTNGRQERVRRAPFSNEEGFTHSPVDMGTFDPEAYLAGQLLEEGESEMKKFQFNQRRSQETTYDRELNDVRNPSCASSKEDYLTGLPATSVIICFHNEARSALLRTIYSVLQRSPPELISEIILVDDFSNIPEDGQLLAAIPKLRVTRMNERSGLMRARVKGAELAVGPVLTFLDSHCEVTQGWLQPLLSRIKTNHTHVVSPIIDIINKDTMQYTSASPLVKGGFGHNLHFRWDQMSQREMQTRGRIIDPIRTPAIAGGLFAIDKNWFTELGMYDKHMEIWGGENIEMSLRVWMCGGVLEIIPCSRVGHIFRSAMPYSFGPGGTYQNTVAKNIRRTVEVWLDDYKPFFYERNPFSLKVEYGDITERLALRHRLQCKPFSWYIKKIYPLFDPPPIKDFTYGHLRHGQVCLDSLGRAPMQPPELRPCDPDKAILGETQAWALTTQHEIKAHPLCLTHDSGRLFMSSCNGGTKQMFHLHDNGLIQHGPTSTCLGVKGPQLYLDPCDVSSSTQLCCCRDNQTRQTTLLKLNQPTDLITKLITSL